MANQTGLQFTFRADGLSHGELLVTAFDYQEGLSQLFNVSLSLASRRDDIQPQEIVDQSACLTIYQDGEVLRHVHGIVSQFSQGDIGHHHSFYQVTLVPAAARLSLRHNSRIFQQQSPLDIVSTLLQEMQIEHYAFSCQRTSAVREFCVQYRESDLDFIERLAAEEGWCYFFEQGQDKHTLVFSDNLQTSMKFTTPLQYNNLAGGASKAPHINQFGLTHTVAPNQVELKDYSFKKPQYPFIQTQAGQDCDWQGDRYEHFDYPGRYKEGASGEAFSLARLQSLRGNAILAHGHSNIAQLIAGARFDLAEHIEASFNRDWCVLQVSHRGEQPQALEEAGGEGMTRYHNDMTVFPGHLTWVPTQNPKPRVTGPQLVTVTGPKGEEIYCDEHGRVKVQFPWDRYSNNDEHASCWIRVSQDWAGAQYGSMAIPRVGHEVIVHFLEGDPDQPIITGRTYHATNKPPYSLPEHKTRTVLRTETHQGEGYNELRFEDQAGQEEIFIHAQKDLNTLVEHNHSEHIKRDQHNTVARHRYSLIKGNHHLTVAAEACTQIAQDSTWLVDQNLHQKVGQQWHCQAGEEIHQQAGNKVVIDAGVEVTLSGGGSFIKLDPAGVHLVGPAINLNSGGSAGSGSSYGGKVAKLVKGVEQAANSTPVPMASVEAYKDMIDAAVVMMEECDCSGVDSCPIHKKMS